MPSLLLRSCVISGSVVIGLAAAHAQLRGHGGPVREPQRFLRGLVQHRRQREAAILNRLRAGDETIPAMVPPIYQDLPPALHGAASLSVLAQLEDLVMRGVVLCDEAMPGLKLFDEPGHD